MQETRHAVGVRVPPRLSILYLRCHLGEGGMREVEEVSFNSLFEMPTAAAAADAARADFQFSI